MKKPGQKTEEPISLFPKRREREGDASGAELNVRENLVLTTASRERKAKNKHIISLS
jgi:hypothetical protein